MSKRLQWSSEITVLNHVITIPVLDDQGSAAGELVLDAAAGRELIRNLIIMTGYQPEGGMVFPDFPSILEVNTPDHL